MKLLSRRCILSLFAIFIFTAPLSANAQTAPWQWESSLVPRARVFQGLWYEFFKIDGALRDAGIPFTTVSITALPKDDEKLAQDAVIVLVNTAAPHLTPARLERVKAFVEAGGGLVVLAGQSAYCRGGYAGTPLEEILPVTFAAEGRLRPLPKSLVLSAAPGATWPALDYSRKPATFFIEPFTPKPGAKVEVLAGDKPAIVSGTFGKGRVVAISVMVNGESRPGELPFWEWDEWPHVLGQAIDWAAGARPLKGVEKSESVLKPLTDAQVTELSLGVALSDDLLARAAAHPTPQIAQALFDYSLSKDAATKISFAKILPIVVKFAKPEWGPILAERTVMNADRADENAAWTLMGATRWPEANARLLKLVAVPESRLAAIAGLGYSGDPAMIKLLSDIYDGALRAAQMPGEPQWMQPQEFAKTQAAIAAEAAVALFRLDDTAALEKILFLHRLTRVYEDIYHTAGRRNIKWEQPLQVAELHAIWALDQNLVNVLKKLQLGNEPLPASQLPPFIKLAQSATDPADVDWVLAVMQRSLGAFPTSTWEPLKAAKDGIIERLAKAAVAMPPT